MGIGVSLVLIAFGSILKFAIRSSPSGVDIHTVGVIFILVGLVGMGLSLALYHRRGEVVTRRRVYDDDATGAQIVEERRSYDEPPLP